MGVNIGIDTSNYTTSCALFDGKNIKQVKRLLPVKDGQIGLRQSDAVFLHIKQLPELYEQLVLENKKSFDSIGVSYAPRSYEGSYMPCFLSGMAFARGIAASLKIPLYKFSHQTGHIAAVLYGANRLDLIDKSFLAFHFSGGTTECVKVNNLLKEDIEIISYTNDLNAGQVIDRVGNILGLKFPAGPELEKLSKLSNYDKKIKSTFKDLNPCLSGIENKCSQLFKDKESKENIAKYCIDSINDIAENMAQKAIKSTNISTLVFAGGVMSNKQIRNNLENKFNGIFADPIYSSDNATGISVLTYYSKLSK